MSKLLGLNYREPNFHVLALILLALSGLVLAKMAWQATLEAREHIGQIRSEVVNLADAIAERQEFILGQSEHLLQVLGGVSLTDPQGTWNCDALLARQLKSFPVYDNLAFANTDGFIRCSALPWLQTTIHATQPKAQNALKRLSISPLDPEGKNLLFSSSNIDPNGNIVGSVLALIRASQFLRPIGVRMPPGIQIAILDQKGNWVTAYPSQASWINATRKDNSFIEAFITLKEESTTQISAPDGVTRLYAAKAIHGTSQGLTLIVGLTVDETANKLTTNNNLALAGLVLATLALSALIVAFITAVLHRFKHVDLRQTYAYTHLNSFFISVRDNIKALRVNSATQDQDEITSNIAKLTDYETLKRAFVIHEERTRYIERLDQLSQSLQSCVSNAEVASAVALCAKDMIPKSSGALLLKTGPDKSKMLVKWGNYIHDEILQTKGCCAMLQNQPDCAGEAITATNCSQLSTDQSKYICIPLITHNELVGALHLIELDTASHVSRPAHTHWVANSIAERAAIAIRNAKQLQKLRFKATRDVLTGLYNRRFMEETLIIEERRALRRGLPIGIMMLDVDHFKRYNDTYGHDAGDALLRTFGGLVQTTVRKCDIPCRYGGEEFVVILPGADLKDTCQRAEMLRIAIENLDTRHNNQALGVVTVSIGAASFPQNGDSWQSVLKKADQALYQAKHAGRNRVAEPAIQPIEPT